MIHGLRDFMRLITRTACERLGVKSPMLDPPWRRSVVVLHVRGPMLDQCPL